MAQAATMGPPLSPRETRRSGRRSAPSASVSTSKSPDSPAPESAPRTKDSSARSVPPNNNPNPRTKRPKQEDIDDPIPNKNPHPNGSAPNHANSNGRSKRKGKEKEKLPSMDQLAEPAPSKHSSASACTVEPQEDDTEEQGITRCICGMNEDDAEGGEFMVQCETCNVWQHGLCMGFESEAQLAAAADYYCEQCKPERHQDLLKRLAKKARESSTHSRNTTSRLSRSHSPTHLFKPPKRRNTMNSRDAAFDESLKELIEATAAEAAAATDLPKPGVNGCISGQSEVPGDDSNGRKKRKRGEDDALPKKRTRSASSASDVPDASASVMPEELPPPTKRSTGGKSGNSRNRRGGPRKTVPALHDAVVSAEGDEGTGPSKRSTQTNRVKAGPTPKRPPPSSHAPGSIIQDSASKRHHSGTGGVAASSSAENSRAYRNSHAYAISQQPLFTSWNLPDYLAHLEHMLPTNIPRPLEVRSLAIGPGGRDSLERTMERGVKVKWPSKRMSVGDMNKRVRALVEWVGREQAGALDRGRRREALERALKGSTSGIGDTVSDASVPDDRDAGGGHREGRESPMVVDKPADNTTNPHAGELVPPKPALLDPTAHQSTMRMMEELMEELINFQERFGPGIKSRDRERRPAS